MRLGIDFGTTRTVVAAAVGGRYPVASFEHEDAYRDYLPSIAAFEGGRPVFGGAARAAIARGDGTALSSIKRTITGMRPDDVIPGFGTTTAVELTAAYLTWVRAMVVQRGNLELDDDTRPEAMVAVPANASSQQRFLTIEAFARAGFSACGLINEPTAAAIEFAHRHRTVVSSRSPKRYVVVYDLGGGTFDTAAVSLRRRRFDLISARGVARLGGADFDEVILQLATDAAGIDLDAVTTVRRIALLEACREAKETLRPGSKKLLVDLGLVDDAYGAVVLDTKAMYDPCRPMIERTLTMVEELFDSLRARDIDPDDGKQLGGLYLVGGSSAFPPLARALRDRFGRKVQLSATPHAATAIGLAIAADPAAGVFVREAMTRHFGVWREGDGGRDKVFDPILRQDAVATADAPVVVERRYRPVHRVGHLRFLECSELDESGQPRGDLTPWDDIRFPYDPALVDADLEVPDLGVQARTDSPAAHDIVETYTHRRDGTIAVQIEHCGAGIRRTYQLAQAGRS